MYSITFCGPEQKSGLVVQKVETHVRVLLYYGGIAKKKKKNTLAHLNQHLCYLKAVLEIRWK